MAKTRCRWPLFTAVLAVPLAAWGCGGNKPSGDVPRGQAIPAAEAPPDAGPGRGPGGFGGPPQPGQVLPPFLQDRLNLSDDQRKQIEELQKDADARLGQILTDEQKKQLSEMRGRRSGPQN